MYCIEYLKTSFIRTSDFQLFIIKPNQKKGKYLIYISKRGFSLYCDSELCIILHALLKA